MRLATALYRAGLRTPRRIVPFPRYKSSGRQTFKNYISSPYVPLGFMLGWVASELMLLIKYKAENDLMLSRTHTKKAFLESLIARAQAGEEIDLEHELVRLNDSDEGLQLIIEELESIDKEFVGIGLDRHKNLNERDVEQQKDMNNEKKGMNEKQTEYSDSGAITSAKFL